MEIVKIENVRKSFQETEALKGISFALSEGEIFGYVGPNGAGKTTTIRLILGLLATTSGRVSVFGIDPYSNEGTWRSRIGAVLETQGVYEDLSVWQNLAFFGELYRVQNLDQRIHQALEMMDLTMKIHTPVRHLSKGMKKKLDFARAFLHDPDLYIFDELTSGLDPFYQKEVRRAILDLQKKGKTILFSSHNLHEVQDLSTRIAFLQQGQILAMDMVEAVVQSIGGCKLKIRADQAKERVEQILAEFPGNLHVLDSKQRELDVLLFNPDEADLISFLSAKGVDFEEIERESLTLEDVFFLIMEKRS
jgi:ABC-2 type transport system ATP-binding protein